MELCTGGELTTRLKQKRYFKEEVIVMMLTKICCAGNHTSTCSALNGIHV